MRPNLGYYIQTINQIVQETEKIGEEMNPKYEEIRSAIDEKKIDQLDPSKLMEIKEFFEKGTAQYRNMLKQLSGLRPPAKVMVLHKKFEKSYMAYVAGCDEMIQSLDGENGVAVEAFENAEMKQDKATDELSITISKLTKMLLN